MIELICEKCGAVYTADSELQGLTCCCNCNKFKVFVKKPITEE